MCRLKQKNSGRPQWLPLVFLLMLFGCGKDSDEPEYSYEEPVEINDGWDTGNLQGVRMDDEKFEELLPLIKKHSTDERNYVKKAVNWALRNIGKRNVNLNKKAIKIAEEIKEIDSKSARWIANDAIRELTSEKIQKRFLLHGATQV